MMKELGLRLNAYKVRGRSKLLIYSGCVSKEIDERAEDIGRIRNNIGIMYDEPERLHCVLKDLDTGEETEIKLF